MGRKTNVDEGEKIHMNNMLLRYAYDLLTSELDGIYDEVDKLCKKAPREPASDLQTKVVNGLICKTKHFLTGDGMIDEISPFIPAGDNPEYRDTLTVLRQLRQGLSRFHNNHSILFTYDFKEDMNRYAITDAHVAHLFNDTPEGKG